MLHPALIQLLLRGWTSGVSVLWVIEKTGSEIMGLEIMFPKEVKRFAKPLLDKVHKN